MAVLRIASATRNSESQFYVRRIQVSKQNLESLHKKVIAKLALHQINDVNVALTIQLAKDRAITFTSLEQLLAYDVNVEALTELLTFKWSFVFSPERNGVEHLHSIYVRVSESPNPNLILQKMLSSQTEDIDSLERGAFAPVVCKIDFVDGRFSSEVLALVTEWVGMSGCRADVSVLCKD